MAIDPAYLQIGWKDPSESFLQGVTGGLQTINNVNALKANQAEAERKQKAFVQQQLMQQDLVNFSNIQNKTAKDYSDIISRYPSLAEPYQKSWEMLDTGQRKQALSTAAQVMSAIKTNNPEIAQDIMEEQAVALENSGDKEAAFNMRRMKGMIGKNPNSIYASLGLFGNAVSPDEFGAMMDKFGAGVRADELQPIVLSQAKANVAKTEAETGDIQLAAEDRRTSVENTARKNELENQYNYDKLAQDSQLFYDGLDNTQRIEADRLRARKNETSTQRMERLEKAEGFAIAAKNAADASVHAARLANLTAENGGAYWDRLWRIVPGSSENSYVKDIETLKSQVFLAQIDKMRGLGALTEREGDALKSSIASLDINQGPKRVQENLTQIAKIMSEAAKSANKKTQIYSTKGQGYAPDVVNAAKSLGITVEEAQKFVNDNGL